jgi:hypothetical protein
MDLALEAQRLLQDAAIDAFDRGRAERAGAAAAQAREQAALAAGDMEGRRASAFELADLQREAGTQIEQVEHGVVELVNAAAPLGNFWGLGHGVSGQNKTGRPEGRPVGEIGWGVALL